MDAKFNHFISRRSPPTSSNGDFCRGHKVSILLLFRFLSNYFFNHSLVWGIEPSGGTFQKESRKNATYFHQHSEKVFFSVTQGVTSEHRFSFCSWKCEETVERMSLVSRCLHSPIANSVQNIKALRTCSYCSLLSRPSSCWSVRSQTFNHKKLYLAITTPLFAVFLAPQVL